MTKEVLIALESISSIIFQPRRPQNEDASFFAELTDFVVKLDAETTGEVQQVVIKAHSNVVENVHAWETHASAVGPKVLMRNVGALVASFSSSRQISLDLGK